MYESEVVCLYSYPIATAETCVRREDQMTMMSEKQKKKEIIVLAIC
jgi:hypothetical protein